MSEIHSLSQLDPNGYYTYADFKSWKFSERVELFKRWLVKMSPAPNRRHQEISGIIFNTLFNYLKGKKCKVFSVPFDVRLPVSRKIGLNDTVVQPDITVVCNLSKLGKQGCDGSPNMVVEILSPGNTKKER